MSTYTELKSIWTAITNLKRRIDCACSRPNIPQPPTSGGPYYLTYTPSTNTYSWEAV